jgi:lipooligosaccharide transport system ATP-binding protein
MALLDVPGVRDVAVGAALRLRGVVKTFGGVAAVAGVDLDVPEGTCLGLLGPNGAGKSTTMRMLTGQSRADEGTIEIHGYRVPAQSKQARSIMGFVPQRDDLDEELTARQNLDVFARLYRVPPRERREVVERALGIATLTDRADVPVDDLSGGMRRRLLLARGLVHSPRLVIMDEPTVGLDPQVRQQLWTLIDLLRAEGTTVLMSTHYIEEAERLADQVAMMSRGRVVARGAPRDLVATHAGTEVLERHGSRAELAEVEAAVAAAGYTSRRNGPAVAVLHAEELPAELAKRLGNGLRRPARLEDVFVLLTGESVE